MLFQARLTSLSLIRIPIRLGSRMKTDITEIIN